MDIRTPKILTLPRPYGKAYVVADLHGNLACFQEVIAKLKADDHLYIAGDFVDRLPGSQAIIDEIIRINKTPDSPVIHPVKGNHEQLCLDSIKIMESIIKSMQQKKRKLKHFKNEVAVNPDLNLHVINGGEWLMKLFDEELMSGSIAVVEDEVNYRPGSSILGIKNFFSSLPYIILVAGEDPFYVVHADMPLNDEIINERLAANGDLNADEVSYALWARPAEIAEEQARIGRNEESILAYCGHTIVVDNEDGVVRKNNNAIDADVGCYMNNVILLINHSDKTAEYVGNSDTQPQEVKTKLAAILHKLSAFLTSSKLAEV